MNPFENDILVVQHHDKYYHCGIVQKQSESGITSNLRLFFVLPGEVIGYLSKIPKGPQDDVFAIPPKWICPLNKLKSLLPIPVQKSLQVEFRDHRGQTKQLVFRVKTINLLQKWVNLIKDETNTLSLSVRISKTVQEMNPYAKESAKPHLKKTEVEEEKQPMKETCWICGKTFLAKSKHEGDSSCPDCQEGTRQAEELFKQGKIQIAKDAGGGRQDPDEEYNFKQCKVCFDEESTMINLACRHLMMCSECYASWRIKHQNNPKLPCPVCKKVGLFIHFVAPIYS